MKKQKSERGQSLVELSISLLVLLYLLSGAVEFGLAFFQFVQLRDAAQEGALYASIHPLVADLDDIENRVKYSSTVPINLEQALNNGTVTMGIYIDDNPAVTTDDIASTHADYKTKNCEGHGIKVVVHYDHKVFMPFLSEFIGNTIPLNATVTDTILTPWDCNKDP